MNITEEVPNYFPEGIVYLIRIYLQKGVNFRLPRIKYFKTLHRVVYLYRRNALIKWTYFHSLCAWKVEIVHYSLLLSIQ